MKRHSEMPKPAAAKALTSVKAFKSFFIQAQRQNKRWLIVSVHLFQGLFEEGGGKFRVPSRHKRTTSSLHRGQGVDLRRGQ